MYAVVIIQSFDSDVPMCLFTTKKEAKAYLNYTWENAYDTEKTESIVGLDESECFHKEEYAKITWNDGDTMEFILTFDSSPDAEFEEVKEKYMKGNNK